MKNNGHLQDNGTSPLLDQSEKKDNVEPSLQIAQRNHQIQKTKTKKQHHKKQPNLYIGMMGCLGGLCLHLVIGSLYQWGIINLYIASYYRLTNQPQLTLQQTAIAFPLMFLSIGLTMKLGLYLSQKTHPLIVFASVTVLQALSMVIASQMPSLWWFIVFYGIFFGLVAGNCFVLTMFECNKYLVGKKMYVNGVILIGTGLGSLVFGLFSYDYLNPNQLSPLNGYYMGTEQLQYIAMEVPKLVKWLGVLYFSIGMTGTILIAPVCIHNRRVQNENKQHQRLKHQQKQQAAKLRKSHHQQQHHQQQTANKNQNQTQTKNSHSQKQQNHQTALKQNHEKKQKHLNRHQRRHLHQANSIKQAISSRIFWVSIGILILASCGTFVINGNYKTYVKSTINDDKFLTIVGVVGSVGNGCTRFFWNLFFYKTGYKTTFLTLLVISAIVYSTIRFTVQIKQLYLIQVFLINCCLGGFLVTTPTALLSLFGHTTGANIYGIYWQVFGIANMMGYLFVSQLAKAIGFNGVIYVCLGMVLVSFQMVIKTKYQGPWENDTTTLEFFVTRQVKRRDQKRKLEEQQQRQNGDVINSKARLRKSIQKDDDNRTEPSSAQQIVTNQ